MFHFQQSFLHATDHKIVEENNQQISVDFLLMLAQINRQRILIYSKTQDRI